MTDVGVVSFFPSPMMDLKFMYGDEDFTSTPPPWISTGPI